MFSQFIAVEYEYSLYHLIYTVVHLLVLTGVTCNDLFLVLTGMTCNDLFFSMPKKV